MNYIDTWYQVTDVFTVLERVESRSTPLKSVLYRNLCIRIDYDLSS